MREKERSYTLYSQPHRLDRLLREIEEEERIRAEENDIYLQEEIRKHGKIIAL